jgi:hypothetical protein
MQKSKINEYIIAQRAGNSPEEIASVQFYFHTSNMRLLSTEKLLESTDSARSTECLVTSV